jgi:hypothetical protein
MLTFMPRSFDQLVDEFNAGRLAYADFAKLAKETTPVPALVLSQLQEAYGAARAAGFPKQRPGMRGADLDRERPELVRLSNALEMALAVPDRSYTASLCEIAAEREWLFGCQEMALEVLWDLCDPASFEPMVELCCRPDLKFDPLTGGRRSGSSCVKATGGEVSERHSKRSCGPATSCNATRRNICARSKRFESGMGTSCSGAVAKFLT